MSSTPGTSAAADSALQVLAATASDDNLCERLATAPNGGPKGAAAPSKAKGKKKKSRDAGEEDASAIGSISDSFSKQTGLRKGKWTVEEEEYATRYIHYFSSGLLTLPEGMTLRASLADKLQCDPMRITKKYAGASCLGNKISRLSDRPKFSPQDIEVAQMDIARLERRFQLRLSHGVGAPLPPDEDQASVASGQSSLPSAVQAIPVAQQSTADTSNGALASLFAQVGGAASGVLPGHGTMPSSMNAPTPAAPPSAPSNLTALLQANPWVAAALQSNPQFAAALSSHPQILQAALAQANAQVINNLHVAAAQASPPVAAPGSNPNLAALTSNAQFAAALAGRNAQNNPPPVAAQPAPQLMSSPAATLVQQLIKPQQHANPAVSNDQIIEELLLQITRQLQVLATLSPATMKQIQLQILASALNSPPSPMPHAPQAQALIAPAGGGADAATMLLQLAASGQLPAGLSSLLAAQQGAPAVQPLAPFAHVPALSNAPLLNPQFGIQGLGAVNQPAVSQQMQVQPNQAQQQKRKRNPAKEAKKTESRPTEAVDKNSNMVELLSKLQQGHAKAAAQKATREQAEAKKTESRPSEPVDKNSNMTELLSKLRQGHANAAQKTTREQAEGFAKAPSHSTSSLTNSGSSTDEAPIAKNQKKESMQKEEAKQKQEPARIGSSSSDEDAESDSAHHRQGPLRKRFRSGSDGRITKSSLADHDGRMEMAEETKKQDK